MLNTDTRVPLLKYSSSEETYLSSEDEFSNLMDDMFLPFDMDDSETDQVQQYQDEYEQKPRQKSISLDWNHNQNDLNINQQDLMIPLDPFSTQNNNNIYHQHRHHHHHPPATKTVTTTTTTNIPGEHHIHYQVHGNSNTLTHIFDSKNDRQTVDISTTIQQQQQHHQTAATYRHIPPNQQHVSMQIHHDDSLLLLPDSEPVSRLTVSTTPAKFASITTTTASGPLSISSSITTTPATATSTSNRKSKRVTRPRKVKTEQDYVVQNDDEDDDQSANDNDIKTMRKRTSSEAGMSSTSGDDKKVFTSRFRGVCWYKRTGKWVVQIKINGKRKHIGYYTKEEDAAEAYDEALRQLMIVQKQNVEKAAKSQVKIRAPRKRAFNNLEGGSTSAEIDKNAISSKIKFS